ncbi:hypothetical protein A6764_09020 [Brevibacillus sp. WF146]|uniref:hypothetical protein n=1 Tax=Brevibacillus sp. WF146 TaxID=319501 RepID=UPI0007EC3975|nr:hypothetical protein [Brevibacillus sp. WF146]UYZ15048.1 hypothetical protein A6764_09020 [Brevibacillus sp. WF146]
MKNTRIVVASITVLVLSAGSLSHSLAKKEPDEFEKGQKYAQIYTETVKMDRASLPLNAVLQKNVDITITQEEINDKIARYTAYSQAFGVTLTPEQAIDKVIERHLLKKYALENKLYPSEKEIIQHIQDIKNSYLQHQSPLIEGMIDELGLSVNEFFFDFLRDGYEEDLVRLHIINKLKAEHKKWNNESDNDYHNRMIEELHRLIENLKNNSNPLVK